MEWVSQISAPGYTTTCSPQSLPTGCPSHLPPGWKEGNHQHPTTRKWSGRVATKLEQQVGLPSARKRKGSPVNRHNRLCLVTRISNGAGRHFGNICDWLLSTQERTLSNLHHGWGWPTLLYRRFRITGSKRVREKKCSWTAPSQTQNAEPNSYLRI